jgi:leucyl-tRNA synthetase
VEAKLLTTYPFEEIENVWQRKWEEAGVFHAGRRGGKEKYFVFELPPFPNGTLHLGHVRNYAIGDATARFRRMLGYNVLYTTGFDAFGLPNDIAAREKGCHPEDWTNQCVSAIQTQFTRLGLSHDRRRIIAYHAEKFYRWTQYLFLQLLREGLAYRGQALVNWCGRCLTTLADDQLDAGKCWRCETPTERRVMTQWFVRETVFADALLQGMQCLPGWPSNVKQIQAHWIGKTEGAEVRFALAGTPQLGVTAFTTRLETIAGARFVAVSLGHPVLDALKLCGLLGTRVVEDLEALPHRGLPFPATRDTGGGWRGEVEGVRLGADVVHPLTGEPLPLVVASYVDPTFGTGAVMGVPAHDARDHELALKLGLGSSCVLSPPGLESPVAASELAWDDSWVLVRSGRFSGLTVPVAREAILRALADMGAGKIAAARRLRDWLVSRQRYWGPPIPVVYCAACGVVPVPETDLPVRLPRDVDLDRPGNPLEYHRGFVAAPCPGCGRAGRRETDTLDTFFNGLWPFLWYSMGLQEGSPFTDPEVEYWMPVDVAIGGVEHATTVYFHDRCFVKAIKSMGYVDYDEPFRSLLAIEMVLRDGRKMSKHLGNAVDPDDLIRRYGADALRLGILSAASPRKAFNWSEEPVKAAHKFLAALWHFLAVRAEELRRHPPGEGAWMALSDPLRRRLARWHDTAVRKVTLNMKNHSFHLASLNLMVLFSFLERFEREVVKRRGALGDQDWAALAVGTGSLLRMLAPLTPHIAEELWCRLGGSGVLARASWPGTLAASEEEATTRSRSEMAGRALGDPTPCEASASRELPTYSDHPA